MPIPPQREIAAPLLHLIYTKGGIIQPQETINLLAKYFNLSELEISTKYQKSGDNIFENRIRWARYLLCEKDLLLRNRYGTWVISEKGKIVIKEVGLDNATFPSSDGYLTLSEVILEKKKQTKQEETLFPVGNYKIEKYSVREDNNNEEELVLRLVLEELAKDDKKRFPDDFILQDYKKGFYEVKLSGTQLQLATLSNKTITSKTGHFRYEAKSKAEAKYIIYGHKIGENCIKIPEDPLILCKVVLEYEKHCTNIKNKAFNLTLELVNYDDIKAKQLSDKIIEKLGLRYKE